MQKQLMIIPLVLLILVGCSSGQGPEKNSYNNSSITEASDEERADGTSHKSYEEIDFDEVRPNELGQIMILMYHQIGPKEQEWMRTPDNFRKDLQALYDNGYRLVSLKDVLKGEISVAAGYTPLVITFDDGTEGQFRYIEKNGEVKIDPDSAVGILLEMNEQNPGFGTAATFYVNTDPFRQPEYTERKLKMLMEFGMDIGNHTLNHPNLKSITSKEEMEKQMGGLVAEIQTYLPHYEINSLALPFGVHPSEDLYPYAIKGQFNDIEYHNKGILLVGSHPSQSPFHKDFNPLKIPRIRGEDSMDYGYIYYWIDFFDRNPHLRYVSDGNPNYITFPKELIDNIDTDSLNEKTIRTY